MESFETSVVFKNEKARGLKYCRYCGKPLIFANTSDTGAPVNPIWEAEVGFHTECYSKYTAKRQEKENKKNEALKKEIEKEEQELAKPISDEMMSKYVRKTETEEK